MGNSSKEAICARLARLARAAPDLLASSQPSFDTWRSVLELSADKCTVRARQTTATEVLEWLLRAGILVLERRRRSRWCCEPHSGGSRGWWWASGTLVTPSTGSPGGACEEGRPLVGPPIRCSKGSPWWRRAARQVSAPQRRSRVGHLSWPERAAWHEALSCRAAGLSPRPSGWSALALQPRLPRGSRRPLAVARPRRAVTAFTPHASTPSDWQQVLAVRRADAPVTG